MRQNLWDSPQMARVGRARREPNLSPCGWLKQTTGSGVQGEPTYSPHLRPLIHGSGLCGEEEEDEEGISLSEMWMASLVGGVVSCVLGHSPGKLFP